MAEGLSQTTPPPLSPLHPYIPPINTPPHTTPKLNNNLLLFTPRYRLYPVNPQKVAQLNSSILYNKAGPKSPFDPTVGRGTQTTRASAAIQPGSLWYSPG